MLPVLSPQELSYQFVLSGAQVEESDAEGGDIDVGVINVLGSEARNDIDAAASVDGTDGDRNASRTAGNNPTVPSDEDVEPSGAPGHGSVTCDDGEVQESVANVFGGDEAHGLGGGAATIGGGPNVQATKDSQEVKAVMMAIKTYLLTCSLDALVVVIIGFFPRGTARLLVSRFVQVQDSEYLSLFLL